MTVFVTAKILGCASGADLSDTGEATDAFATMGDDESGDESTGGRTSPPPPPPPPSDTDDCDIGTEDCQCTAGGSCDQGLVCEGATCIPALEFCGDGVINGDESCDDGNDIDDDECSNLCGMGSCGDGEVQEGEACDDGNADDDDGCTQTCECRSNFEAETQTDGWELSGDWSLYSGAPMSDWGTVPFGSHGQALGTDGNRATPYPGEEIEASSATTPSFIIPETLSFRSWHADEGGGVTYDNKRVLVSIDAGATWTALVDCAAGPYAGLPFCQPQEAPRDAGDWDDIEIDAAEYSGVPGQVRFEYDTVDECCGFEQGWFIDDLSGLGCP